MSQIFVFIRAIRGRKKRGEHRFLVQPNKLCGVIKRGRDVLKILRRLVKTRSNLFKIPERFFQKRLGLVFLWYNAPLNIPIVATIIHF